MNLEATTSDEVFEESYYEEPDRRSEVIASCLNAISATECYDTIMEDKETSNQINQIRKMSLKLIHYYITEIYNEHFEDETY
jgi:hypothetical protein